MFRVNLRQFDRYWIALRIGHRPPFQKQGFAIEIQNDLRTSAKSRFVFSLKRHAVFFNLNVAEFKLFVEINWTWQEKF